MSEKDKSQIISEYKTTTLKNFDDMDEKYLEKRCFKIKGQKLFEVYEKNSKYRIDNGPAAGVIQLRNTRLCLITKVPTHLLYMLRFLKSEKDFLFDPDTIIDIEGGDNFFDIIARFFLNELKKIIRIGLLPKYIKKCENRDDLKGDLDIEGQINNDINDIFKFSCIYHDLTVDNLENRIVLKAINTLIPMIRFDNNIKRGLKAYEHMIRGSVKLADIESEDCNKIHFDVSNEHYFSIIRLSKVILKKSFIKSIYEGKSIGLNFVVNMNTVFQNFLTDIIKDVTESEFPKFIAKDQKTFRSFIRWGRVRPDAALKLRHIESYPIIIELKYKKKVKQSDKVQAGTYSISEIPGAKISCIICAKPNDKKDEEKIYDYIRPNMMKGSTEEEPLLTYTIDLRLDENLSYGDFIRDIKDRIKYIISDLILEADIPEITAKTKEKNMAKIDVQKKIAAKSYIENVTEEEKKIIKLFMTGRILDKTYLTLNAIGRNVINITTDRNSRFPEYTKVIVIDISDIWKKKIGEIHNYSEILKVSDIPKLHLKDNRFWSKLGNCYITNNYIGTKVIADKNIAEQPIVLIDYELNWKQKGL